MHFEPFKVNFTFLNKAGTRFWDMNLTLTFRHRIYVSSHSFSKVSIINQHTEEHLPNLVKIAQKLGKKVFKRSELRHLPQNNNTYYKCIYCMFIQMHQL